MRQCDLIRRWTKHAHTGATRRTEQSRIIQLSQMHQVKTVDSDLARFRCPESYSFANALMARTNPSN